MRKNSSKKNLTSPAQGTKTLAKLQQIRALAHPLRLRILGALVRAPRTTKQVADLLGEKHTKLYHHVRELERAKVIRLTETRPKRGTIERYYQATAAMFHAAPSVFSRGSWAGGTSPGVEAVLDTLFESARADVLARVGTEGRRQLNGKEDFLAARLLIQGPRKKVLEALRRQISRSFNAVWATGSKRLASQGAPNKGRKRAFALTIILCPKDPG